MKVIGVVGEDQAGQCVRNMLAGCGADATCVLVCRGRPTVCKMRLVGSAQHKNPQQMIRVDFEHTTPLSEEDQKHILEVFDSALKDADIVCIEDYNKGLLTASLTQQLIERARTRGLPVIIDPGHIADYARYAGATAIKSNRIEAERATGMSVRTPEQYPVAAEKLLEALNLEAAIVTLDRQGSYLATRDGQRQWIKTRERQVTDGTGAGDMMLAMITMARAGGATGPRPQLSPTSPAGLKSKNLASSPSSPKKSSTSFYLKASSTRASSEISTNSCRN